MSDKSFVSLEQHVCAVCGQQFDTGNILLDQRLKDRFEHKTTTGWGLCPEHQKLYADGYIALIGVDPALTPGGSAAALHEIHRTGEVAHIRRSVFSRLFTCEPPEGPLAVVTPEVIEHLKKLMATHAPESPT